MKWLVVIISMGLGIAFGMMTFAVGKKAALRECPAAQQGERLLASEQRADATLCTYADGWNGYGHKITVRLLP